MTRRWWLRTALGVILARGYLAASPASAQQGMPARSPLLGPAIAYVLEQPSEHPYSAVLDYSVHSSQPRFHVIDRSTRTIAHSFVVAHGIGSEPEDNDGIPQVFLDVPDSFASSIGLFRTDEIYMSPTEGNGLSMRLRGLSPTNSNAYKRLIVIHAQWYVEPEFVALYGKAGRSDGCLVFSSADRDTVIDLLRGGALIFAVAGVA
ncbi:murein L,D-transpeptidase catalytic domain family protein [Variovorax sp. J22P240]|uniref:murein L,D-transpeptidase catalytic domain-containing protein n=1 Tax=Variovorax sp. J22P240 TaxID=3053514 RepID=UPI002577FD60|nr:murein L,D-transpeptidase catalytic domain family protein [Variovorax sp. J22P240]MDM0000532.1 murein L,D-transpeptidase catalytic domain family protein [Variovorax sp. J22P240]